MKTVKVSEMAARGSKNLLDGNPARRPSWPVFVLVKALRLAIITLLWIGIGMGAGLFCGIVGVVLLSLFLHRSLDMTEAYRYVAIPTAIGAGSVAFIWNLIRTMQDAAGRGKQDGREGG
jgi:uncharacterized membrane protein